ncbi:MULTISPECIES: protease modulator HflC [Sphingopyxis]|jgi:membrane protease subunit HflC|uniref:Protein HflC n=1 Tax=Sphingopyxis granuli TaxID=267128 RepID=A0AA86GMY8_9SPHN|nr:MULTISPECIES: protease modulator HflC [Sphingopyxis]AMG76080.1 Membrane protease subunit HflC [Sphingopyxis granuli]ODU27570.1 MAG: protease modulator HflC [Sphingopyxis sp. SCN 67-31]QUM73287.1 protease modulator HflC [Sphingopyxis granuli]
MFESLMRNPLRLLVGLLAFLVLLSQTLAIVPEDKQALILRFGEIERTVNRYKSGEQFGRSGAGLVVRVPFIDGIQYIDKRVLGVNMERQQVLSTDQQRLQVDAFARFRITNPVRMYTAIRSEERLQQQLATILGSSLRNELGKRTFATLLSPERGAVMDNIQIALNREAQKYGAEIIDVRIKRADLPEGATLVAAYNRMRSARQQEAIAIRAEGEKEAQIIRGNADGEAARIYAASFGKDPEFYDFYRAMQSYRQTFLGENNQGGSSLILSPDNEYLKRFRGG